MKYYENLIKKHFRITDKEKINEYLNFCLDELKTNIIYLHDNMNPTKNVITEIFKRSMVKKYNLDKQKI